MKQPSSGRSAFTLIELLVACAVGAMLLATLMSILSGSINLSRKTNDSLLAYNAASAALDLIGTDLESLAATTQTNFECLRIGSESVGDAGVSAAKLILLTSSANDTASGTDDSGQVRAVVYRLAYKDVLNSSGTNNIYGIYRFSETNAGAVFTNYIGTNDLSGTEGFTADAKIDDFLAGNIVDFRVRLYPQGSLSPLNTNASDVVRMNGAGVIVGGTTKTEGAATAEVSLTFLEDAGAKLLKNGVALDTVKARYGYTLSKKVPLRTP